MHILFLLVDYKKNGEVSSTDKCYDGVKRDNLKIN